MAETTPLEALARAVKTNNTAAARDLLAAYPELKGRLNDAAPGLSFGATPLLAAVHHRNKELIELLLEAGADINARSHWWAGGFGVLDSDSGLEPFLIERGAEVNIHAAARMGMLERVKQLVLQKPAVLDARGGDGQTPLHVASTIEIADYLVKQGANVDALDIDHESTPAQYMVRERPEIARHLVARGCRTDILMACALGDLGLVRKHLDADPQCIRMNVSERYFPRRNPKAGGTIYIWTLGQNKSAHIVAREFGHDTVYKFLLERSPDELKLTQFCEAGDGNAAKELLASRPGLIAALTPDERRAIANAAQDNNTAAVRTMLTAGWPVDARGQHDATPLHWAAFHGNAEMAEIILLHNPPLECVDADFGGTPLGWAIHGSVNGWHCKTGNYPGTVELLLRAGAKPPQKIGGTEAVQQALQRSRPKT
jgi:ankyrin repeat protein